MIKKFLAGLVLLLLAHGAHASICASYPYNLTNGTVADANQVMSNFNSVRNCVNGNVAPAASPTFTGTVTFPDGMTYSSSGFNATNGTTALTLPVRFGQQLTVKDFGAKGDGTTDDTAAIQADITYMETSTALAPNSGNVYLPCGTYKITSSLLITSGTGMQIFGQNQECAVVSQATANTPVFTFSTNSMHSFLVHDLFVTSSASNSTSSTSAVGILFSGSNSLSYYHFQIYNMHCDYLFRCISDEAGSGAGAQARVWGYSIHDMWQEAHMLGAFYYSDSSVGEPRLTFSNIYLISGSGGSNPAWYEPLFNMRDTSDTILMQQIEFNNTACTSNTVTCLIYATTGLTLNNIRAEAITMAAGASLIQGPGGIINATEISVSLASAVPSSSLAYVFYLSGTDSDHVSYLNVDGISMGNPTGAGELLGYAASNSYVQVGRFDNFENPNRTTNNVSPTPIGVSGYLGVVIAPASNTDNWSQDTICTISQTTGAVYLAWPLCKQYLAPNALTGNMTVYLPAVATGAGPCASVNLIPAAVLLNPGITDVSFTRFHTSPSAFTFAISDCYSSRTLTGAASDNAAIDYRFVIGQSTYGWVPYAQSMPLQ